MVKARRVNMINGPILKNLIIFSLPVMALNVLQIIFHATDIAVLGIYSSDRAVAAVGATTALVNLFINFFTGFSTGTNVLVARAIGEKDAEKAQKFIGTSMFCSVFVGMFLSIIMLIGARYFLTWMNCPDNILDMATLYIRVYFLGMPLILLYNFSAAIMRAVGDTMRPLYFLIIGGVANVLLNIFFVCVLNVHVAGVAVATIISKTITAFLSIRVLLKNDTIAKLKKENLKFYKQEIKEIVYLGLPAGIQTSLFSLSNVVFSSTFNKFGDIAISGNTIGKEFDSIISNALAGFNSATLSFSSQNLGAKNYKRVWKIVGYSLLFSTGLGLFMGIIVYAFSKELCGLMTDSMEVISVAQRRLSIMATTHFLSSIMAIFSNLLKAMKKPILSMVGSIFFTLILRLVWIYTIFPLNPTLETYYIIYPITWALCAIAFAIVGLPMLASLEKKHKKELEVNDENLQQPNKVAG